MAKFNAGTAVERMEYDFTDFGGTKGTIPEPTSKHVDTFFNTVKTLAKEVRSRAGGKDLGDLNEEEAADAIAEMDTAVIGEYEDELSAAIGDLCQSTPSADEIANLPFRVRAAFMQWLVGELRPEAPRPATKR